MAQVKLTKKELEHDPLQDALFDLVHKAYEHRLALISGAVAVLLVAGAALGGYAYYLNQRRAAAEAFYRATAILDDTALTQEESFKQAAAAFTTFVSQYSQSRLAPAAHLYLAKIAWHQQALEDAAHQFRQVLDEGDALPEQRAIALTGLGMVLETQGKPDQAKSTYEQLPDPPFGDLKAFNLGRLAMASGNDAEARRQFQRVIAAGTDEVELSQQAKDALSFLP